MNDDEQEKKLEQELREGLDDSGEDDSEPIEKSEDTQPIKQPEQTPEPAHHSSAGIVILQWLSYAFWAWLVIGLIWLVNVTLSSTLLDEDISSIIPYALAASIVLLPVAFLVDLFYRKYEPIKKHGAAMVIMVIHAVLYALATIGTLIGAVFIALNMFINDSLSFDSTQSMALYTTLFAALAFGLVFLRVLSPFKSKLYARIFSISMLVISAALIVLGFIGPAMSAYSVRNDRLIEAGLGTLSGSIITYVNENDQLPVSLKDLTLIDYSATALIEKNLVTYKPEGKVEPTKDEDRQLGEDYDQYRYQLCVTYAKESTYTSTYYGMPEDYPGTDDSDEYQTYPDTYNHKAGEVCYKLETYGFKDTPIAL